MLICARMSCLAFLALISVTSNAGEKKADAPKSLDGLWIGPLKTGLADLRLAIKIAKKGDGWTGTMDSIDQGATGILIDNIDFKDGKVKFELKSIKGVFDGTLKDDGSEITGRWKQGGGDLALTLKRTDKIPVVVRPQNPKKPYPYDEHEVKYDSKDAKIKLAGTLTVPRGKGPFPAVILLSGSGPQDRNESLAGHKPFLVIADQLTRQGIAVLRVDDRGVGGSTGDTFTATLEDNALDVLAGIELLKARGEINAAKIGLIGHSEGGILAPFVATKSKDVAFMVLLAGTGLPGEEILYQQGQAILKAMGAKEDALKKQKSIQQLLFTCVKQEPDNDKCLKLVKEKFDELKKTLSPLEAVQLAIQQKALEAQVKTITTPWFRFFLSYDPRPALRKVQVPVLAIVGEKDVQVPPKENLEAMGKALAEGGNKDHTLKELPGLNHLFQTAKTGSLTEYQQIDETFAPAALTLISEWILKRVK